MRVFPMALRGLACVGALSLAVSSGAVAVDGEKQSAAAIQIKLVEARQRLNSLYTQAAMASERLNGAIWEAEQAKAELEAHKRAVAATEKDLRRQRDSVAILTVQDLQSGSGMSRLSTLFESEGPAQLLDRSAAYTSTQEAMAARIDALTASTVVHDSAVNSATAAAKRQKEAVAKQARAKAAIAEAIARAETAVEQTATERATLLEDLASAQSMPIAEVTKRQDEIDKELDAQPGIPTPPNDEPRPTTPKPTTQPTTKPTTPKPTTPKPTQPTTKLPATPKPPVVNPPPASSSKVEKAVSFAMDQLGEPYKWGGAGPNSWDCSGLVMKAWGSAGVSLPHFGGAQYSQTKHVSMDSIQRGDLLFWSNGGPGSIYHVTIYLGGGKMIHAPRTGRNVEIVSINYWIKPKYASRPG